VVLAAAAATTLSACGSSSKTATPSSAPPSAAATSGAASASAPSSDTSSATASAAATDSAAAGGGDVVASATTDLQAAYAGLDRALPTSGPAPVKGTKVVVIPCSLAAEGCATAAQAEVEAGKLLGWDMSIIDGKFDPSNFVAGVRQAIAVGAKGIILDTIDCAPIKAAVQQAQAAGIKVLGVNSLDCDDPSQGGGQKLFAGTLGYGKYDIVSWNRDVVGKTIADYIIAKTKGQAKVIEMHEDDVAGLKYLAQGLDARLAQCTGCTVYRTAFLGTDLANGGVQSKAAAALVAHPDATVVVSPYDAAVLAGIGAAVKATGRPIIVTGNEGLKAAIAQIRAGGPLTMVPGTPLRWSGWAAVDAMIRLLAGQPLVDEGLGLQVVDTEHQLPAKYTFYDGNARTDYEPAYRKIWGVQ